MKNQVDYLLVSIGFAVNIYVQISETKNTLILIVGIIILIFGLYRISKKIPKKKEKVEDDSL